MVETSHVVVMKGSKKNFKTQIRNSLKIREYEEEYRTLQAFSKATLKSTPGEVS